MVSHTTQFLLWRFYRSRIVPACILAALLSILFGGALVLEDALAVTPANRTLTTWMLNEAIIKNLFAASLLMLCHATYLALMAYHLVFRFPIERRQWVSVAYLAIVFAYFAHARHAYLEATDKHGILGAAWWSSGAFAITYFAMACHGVAERGAERADARCETQRSTRQVRGEWMLWTDIGVCVFAVLMLLRAVGLFDWSALLQGVGAKPVTRGLLELPLARELYAQASPKDAVIAVALGVYVLARFVAHRRLRAGQIVRSERVLAIQSISSGVDWAAIRSSLPRNSVWLDLACGRGTDVRELIEHLYKNDPAFPQETIFLDKDHSVLSAAPAKSPQWWPESAKQTYQNADMRSLEARTSLARCQVVHLAHAAYDPGSGKAALHLLRFARPGTLLLVRYTSNASFYRVISTSMACAVLRPYIHHYTHTLLLEDLERSGWKKQSPLYILPRNYDISKAQYREETVDWVGAEYGEFSGDVIERYFGGFAADGQTHVLNSDRLVLLTKS
jgi:hypothetical protein